VITRHLLSPLPALRFGSSYAFQFS
jgi:hypothetical protein